MSRLPALLAGALLVVGLAACGSPPPDPDPVPTLPGTDTVVTTAATALGTVLVDGRGRTLYRFSSDPAVGTPACTAACAAQFPPYLADGAPQLGEATLSPLKGELLGTRSLPSARQQVTFAGAPLYFFRGDVAPGATNGVDREADGGTFAAVSTAGAPVSAAVPAARPVPTAGR